MKLSRLSQCCVLCIDHHARFWFFAWTTNEPQTYQPLLILFSSTFYFCTIVVDCDLLSNITNGMLSYNPQGQDQTLLGATVTYTCNTGYTLNGNNMRTCLTGGAWSGSDPTCDGKYRVFQINEWPFIFLCNKLA